VRLFEVDRIGRLRQDAESELQRRWPNDPILKQITRVVCDDCGFVLHLSLERFGLDWPEQLEGWGTVEGVGDLCPRCVDRHGGDGGD
jgi:hypothetical protein